MTTQIASPHVSEAATARPQAAGKAPEGLHGRDDFAKLLHPKKADPTTAPAPIEAHECGGEEGNPDEVAETKRDAVTESGEEGEVLNVLILPGANAPEVPPESLPEAEFGEVDPASEPRADDAQRLSLLVPDASVFVAPASVQAPPNNPASVKAGSPDDALVVPKPVVSSADRAGSKTINGGTFLPVEDGLIVPPQSTPALAETDPRAALDFSNDGPAMSRGGKAAEPVATAPLLAVPGREASVLQVPRTLTDGGVSPNQPLAQLPAAMQIGPESGGASTPQNPAGTPVAKDVRVISDTVSHGSAKSSSAVFSTPENVRSSAVSPEGIGALQAGQSEGPHGDTNQDTTGGSNREGLPFPAPELKSEPLTKPVATVERPSETARVVAHLEQTLERMRTQGTQRIELRLPLQEGGELLVKLQISHGEVKATFHSDSDGFRQALERDWSHFAQRNEERSLKIGAAVFESPSAPSGEDNFQNPRERRGSQAEDPAQSQNFPPASPRRGKPTPVVMARPAAARSSASSLRIYA